MVYMRQNNHQTPAALKIVLPARTALQPSVTRVTAKCDQYPIISVPSWKQCAGLPPAYIAGKNPDQHEGEQETLPAAWAGLDPREHQVLNVSSTPDITGVIRTTQDAAKEQENRGQGEPGGLHQQV